MRCEDIDKVIGRYAEERKSSPRRVAQQHFLLYACLLCPGQDIGPFLKQTRKLLKIQAEALSIFENPFRNSQVCWLVVFFLWFCFSLYLLTHPQHRMAAATHGTLTLVFGLSMWRIVWRRWLETSILIAYYHELIDLIDSQQTPLNSAAPA